LILSIIVPVYNKSNYVGDCIRSILHQTMPDYELILINDGSTDKSGEICDNFKLLDSRIVVIHQKNKGVSSARNAGLNICQGEFIGFIDSDDILNPDMYETLINNAIKFKADIAICGVRRVFHNKVQLFGNKNIKESYNKSEGISNLFSGKILLSNYDKIYRSSTVKHIRFEPALFEDTYYNFEALKCSNLCVYDDTIMYNYMIRENSHSLAPFNQKYMNMTFLTKKMLETCENELPEHIDQARSFDFRTNLMILNIIITDSIKNNWIDYNTILSNLKQYSKISKSLKFIGAKYKCGYYFLLFSPKLYVAGLKIYCFITNSEYLNRKKHST
jgi:glycosyltransferase involved in cell wall biosynthesis